MTADSPVLIDTDVFSHLFVRRHPPREQSSSAVAEWRQLLIGKRVVISFQTRAEVLQGSLSAGWGAARHSALRAVLDDTPTIGVDERVVDANAELYAACRRSGHPLHAKLHAGDRWVAACAIAKNVPMLAGDQIYRDAPALLLVNE